jgi:Gpi18-like mannosyltransferase
MSKIKELLIHFFTWRFFTVLVAIPAIFTLTLRPGFTSLSESDFFRNLLLMWANFEGGSTLKLAEYGTAITGKEGLLYSFFPVYPWLISALNTLVNDSVISALIISNVAFLISLFFLYRLFCLDYKDKIARLAIILILIFPTSFFFGAVYPESVLFLFSILTLYFARKKSFFLASLFAFFASLTQVSGLFLWPALVFEYLHTYGTRSKFFNSKLLSLAIPLIGFVSLFRYQAIRTGASLFEVVSLAFLGVNQVVNKVILLHQIIFRYFKMIILMDHFDPLFFTVLLEIVVGFGFLCLLIFSIKKIRTSYWVYSFLSFIVPTFTGTFSGFPRYVLVLFPLFGFLAAFFEKQHPYFRYLYIIISVSSLILAISFFTRGYFVA